MFPVRRIVVFAVRPMLVLPAKKGIIRGGMFQFVKSAQKVFQVVGGIPKTKKSLMVDCVQRVIIILIERVRKVWIQKVALKMENAQKKNLVRLSTKKTKSSS